MKKFDIFDAPTTTVLLGLTLGLGIVVHGAFFLVALVIVMVALGRQVFEIISGHLHDARLTHRHP